MATARADAKKRVVLPEAKPGDVFDIQNQGEGRLLRVCLDGPAHAPKTSRARCLAAMTSAPLRVEGGWVSLKKTTREP